MQNFLNALKGLAGFAGKTVDTAVPVAVGQRTELSVIGSAVLASLAKLLAVAGPIASTAYPPAAPAIAAATVVVAQLPTLLASLAPVFAFASAVRGLVPAAPAA